MKSLQKYLNLILLLAFVSGMASAQITSPENFSAIDSLTYSQYLSKHWKLLEKTSKSAFREGIDYYYLRMRAGIAMYEQHKYIPAIGQFRKALGMNDIDPVAMEYLYYSLKFSGREQDALLFFKNHEDQLKNRVSESLRPVRNFQVEPAWHMNTESDFRSLFSTENTGTTPGYQIITRRFFNLDFSLEHDLGKRISLIHGGTFMTKYDYYYSQTETSAFDSYEHQNQQYQYYAGLGINPGGGVIIRPSFHYVKFISPRLIYRDRRFGNSFSVPAINENYFLGRLSVFKNLGRTGTAAGVTISDLGGKTQYETDFNIVYYPLGNLNMYLLGTIYRLIEDPGTTNEDRRMIYSGLMGFKVLPTFWLQTELTVGEIKNMAFGEGFIIYDGNETVTSRYMVSLIFPTEKITFSVNGIWQDYYSYFTEASGNETNINKLEFNGLTLTGVLRWNF
jgi:hypothetical protein